MVWEHVIILMILRRVWNQSFNYLYEHIAVIFIPIIIHRLCSTIRVDFQSELLNSLEIGRHVNHSSNIWFWHIYISIPQLNDVTIFQLLCISNVSKLYPISLIAPSESKMIKKQTLCMNMSLWRIHH